MGKIIFDVEPYTFTVSAVIVGLLLTGELSTEEQDSFGNWLQLVGLVIQTYDSQVATLESVKENAIQTNELDTIKESIKKLEEELKNLKNTKDKSTAPSP